MIPVNPEPPRTPKYCVKVYHMVKPGIPETLSIHDIPRCQVGEEIYMWSDERACKILGGRKVTKQLARCKSGEEHKWQLVTRCTGGDVYRPTNPKETLNIKWEAIGQGSEVAFGGNTLYMLGRGMANNYINKWTGSGWERQTYVSKGKKVVPMGRRIAVCGNGLPVFVTSGRLIYRRQEDGAFHMLRGHAIDVACSDLDQLWVMGSNGAPYMWTGTAWKHVPGLTNGLRIAADQDGAWATTRENKIFHYKDGKWTEMPGRAIDISANQFQVAITGTDHNIYRLNRATNEWAKTTGMDALAGLAVGKDGQAFMVNEKELILKQAL